MKIIIKSISTVCITIFLLCTNLRAADIHDAAASGNLERVKALINADTSLLELKDERQSYQGNTPLISACWGHQNSGIPQEKVAKYLISMGADIHAKNDRGATPFYFAAENLKLAKLLVDKGADINVQAYGGYTPLSQAASSAKIEVVEFLIENGAELNILGQRGSILHDLIARKDKHYEPIVKLLVEGGTKLQEFSFGNTELHLAVLQGTDDMVKTLINLGIDVNKENDYGHTPLYYAARHGYSKKTKLLIEAGADKNSIAESNYGKSIQLTEKMNNDEAYLWYLGGNTSPYSGYAVKTKNNLLFFNPTDINNSSEAGLANGYINSNELKDQKITMLITFKNYFGRSGSSVSELSKELNGTQFILNFNPDEDENSGNIIPYKLATPNESFTFNGITVHTIPAIQKAWFGDNGLGYLVEVDGIKIFYPGLHAPGNNEPSEIEKYRKEIDFLKTFAPIDMVILPISGRHIQFRYEQYLYLIDQLSPRAIYLIGDDLANEEHLKCYEAIKTSNIPVFYPEGGIAAGERFHYSQNSLLK